MPVEVFLCEKFRHRHERKAFGRFLQEMLDRFRDSIDSYVIIGEPEANTASMDMIVLTHHAMIVVEMKELTYAEGVDDSEIILRGAEKGGWEYKIEGQSTYNLGAFGKDRNPYQQVRDHNYKLRDWLVGHSEFLPGGPWSKDQAIRKLYSWVVISPGYNETKSKAELDLPWGEIDRWFKLLPLKNLAWEIETAVNPDLDLSVEQMISIATKLGATRRENLSEFVPNYVPPPPKLSFFSRPPVTKQVIDRKTEREALLNYLDDNKVTVISLGGPSGIGKTYIAAWLVSESIQRHYGCIWVDCIDREVTQESFLAAVAYKIPDKYLAAFVCDSGQKITDRFDVVIDYLDQNPCLLIFNDYHRISVEKGLDNFFTRVVQKAINIKILITTRVRPTCIDNPNWAPGSAVEMNLEGVPADFIPSFAKVAELSSEQINGIWERTSGNPYAIGLFMSLLRNRHGNVQIETLPLFDDAKAKSWSDSLIEILPADVRIFASRVAAVRSTLNIDLIEKLSYTSRDKAVALTDQALNAYVLYEVCPGEYQMHEYIREALLSKAGEKEIRKAHGAAGSYFEKLASDYADTFVRAEVILECLYHYENAGNWEGILAHVTTVYEMLISRGDHDRSYTVSLLAVRASKALSDKPQTTHWLIAEIKRELDSKRLDDANKNITEAFGLIPQQKGKLSGDLIDRWNTLEAQLWIQKGRFAYLNSDKDAVDSCLEKGLGLAENIADKAIFADSLMKVAQIERYRGNYIKARHYLTEACNIVEILGDNRLLIICISQLGLIARSLNELTDAKRLFELAYEKARLANDPYGTEINLGLMGDMALRTKDYENAERILRERLEKARASRNSLGIRISLGWLAEALIARGKLEEAEQLLVECDQRVEEAQDDVGRAWMLKRWGQLEHAKGHHEDGNRLIQNGIQVLHSINNVVYLPDFEKALVITPIATQYPLWQNEGTELANQ